jgi:hypothetical protein
MTWSRSLYFLKLSFGLLLCSSLVFCGKKGAEDNNGGEPLPATPPVKFTTYNLISKTRSPGDGFSSDIVKLKVLDENGKPVDHYVMRLISVLEEGVNFSKCTDSDSQGIVTCEIRAHLGGTKTLTIAGTNSTFQVDFTRDFDGRGLKFDAVAMGHAKESAGPDKVSASAGVKFSVPRQQSGTDIMINDVSVSN